MQVIRIMLRKLLGSSVIERIGDLSVKSIVWILSERTVLRLWG